MQKSKKNYLIYILMLLLFGLLIYAALHRVLQKSGWLLLSNRKAGLLSYFSVLLLII